MIEFNQFLNIHSNTKLSTNSKLYTTELSMCTHEPNPHQQLGKLKVQAARILYVGGANEHS